MPNEAKVFISFSLIFVYTIIIIIQIQQQQKPVGSIGHLFFFVSLKWVEQFLVGTTLTTFTLQIVHTHKQDAMHLLKIVQTQKQTRCDTFKYMK